ncbi:MAG TPA: helix-turn-helix domain-containing protein [Leeuwenhoekiella sp.]|nr:helix-turn-helix domain-containing protein [Leeuwenhoekiella sp.]
MANSKDSTGSSFLGSGDRTLVSKLCEHIQTNLNNDQFGVDSLAQMAGMSRSSLHRKLNKALGISTSRFIREYRLKRALEMLRAEDITASEVAYRVGFSSATYFSTSFHKFYGITPGEVKSKMSNEVEKDDELPIPRTTSKFSTDSGNSIEKKNRVKKNLLLTALFITVVLMALFFQNTSSKESSENKVIENPITEKSIAVLPFKNWTGNPDLEYVSDGMTDAVISRLTKIGAIPKVIPFTSTLQYKETKKSIKEIAAELGVENLLQGNLQISGKKIKINLQLINGKTNNHLWSEEYKRDWKSDEIFEIQTEVVQTIAKNMKVAIAENELADIQKAPTKSKQAYSYFLQAEFQKHKSNKLTYANAIPLYEKAIAIDSNFVKAYVGLANIWSFGGLVWGIYNQRLAWKNAKGLLQKALEIDPNNEAVEEELYSGYFYYDWNFTAVEKYYQSKLDQFFIDKTPAIMADYPIKTGRYKEAILKLDQLILNDPTVGIYFLFKAEALMFLNKTDEAKDLATNVDSLYSDNWFYLRESTKLYYYLAEYGKSKRQLHKLLTNFQDYPPLLMWLNAVYAQMDGNSTDAAKYLAELQIEYSNGSSGSPAWFIALYNCRLKDYEQTFEWLQKSYENHEVEMTWLREEPLLAPIRTDPRYKNLYEKVGFSSIGLPIKRSSENQSIK